jgi:hypothetical protein
MKQALEALEEACGDRCNAEYNPCYARTAITSLRQAIEQAEKQVCVACEGNPQGENIPCAVCGAAPQPQQAEKQEPVAYWNGNGKFATPKAKDWDKRTGGTTAFGIDIPLYTTPQPQREWVGLTPADFDWLEQVFSNKVSNNFVFADIVCVISAKLKDKNT